MRGENDELFFSSPKQKGEGVRKVTRCRPFGDVEFDGKI